MKDLTKYYIDLSKCSEGERKDIAKVLFNSNTATNAITLEMLNRGSIIDSDGDDCYHILMKGSKNWCGHMKSETKGKTELTYPEFIKLFEGGENYPGKQYQPLFDHLSKEHGLILLQEEMDEIIRIVSELNSNQ